MSELYAVEIEPEVRTWLEALSDRDFGRVDFLVGLLAEQAETLGEPQTRHLGGKLRELRFSLLSRQTRVTYWLAPQRRIVLPTVFAKTRGAKQPRWNAPRRRRKTANGGIRSRTRLTNGR